jgi:GAF domain-containing protein
MYAEAVMASVGTGTLYGVIRAIAEGPNLDRVLPPLVDLLVQATSCHACFIYLREDDILRMRAASPVFAHAVGRVTLRIDEGLTGWVARHREPAYIREAAFQDPRFAYVPELEEERFQSMVAAPLIDRRGDVIGVVVLHTQAPREFGQDVLDFLVHVASLVVGAIDNARLYDQTERQVTALSALTQLSQKLASLTDRAELYDAGCAGIRRMLGADACQLVLLDAQGGAVEVATTGAHAAPDGQLTARLMDGEEALGIVTVRRARTFSPAETQLLDASANQLALALRKAELIERLAAENLVRQVFDALERGTPDAAARRARSAGWDPNRPHVAIVAAGDVPPDAEQRLRFTAPGALTDASPGGLRALVPLPRGAAEPLERLHADLDALGRELGTAFGISRPRRDLGDDALGLTEAADAAAIARALDPAGGARRFDRLGAYRYLVAHVGSDGPDPAHARALAQLAAYDERRNTTLLATLEAYLAARGAIRATADTLTIHPNTLRQRLRRIEDLTGLDLQHEDLLSLELGLKVHRLGT